MQNLEQDIAHQQSRVNSLTGKTANIDLEVKGLTERRAVIQSQLNVEQTALDDLIASRPKAAVVSPVVTDAAAASTVADAAAPVVSEPAPQGVPSTQDVHTS